MATNTINISIELDNVKNVDKSLKQINSTISGVQKSATAQNSIFKSLGNTFKSVAFNVGTLVGAYAGLSAVKNIADNLIDFNTALTEVTTISEDAANNTKELTSSLIDVSNQFGSSASSQAKTFYQIISAGITDTTKANEALIAANKLAIGGLTNTETAVDVLTTVLNAYGDSVGSAAQVSDVLFKTVQLGKTRVEELASAIPQVAAIGAQIGVSFTEASAAIAQLTTKGFSASEAATQLNAIFTAVLKNQERAPEILGNSADAFSLTALRTKGLSGFLKDLTKASGGSETALTKLLGRAEASKGVLSLASDGFVGLNDKINQVANSTGAAEDAFKKNFNTIGKQVEVFLTRFKNIFLNISLNGQDVLLDGLIAVNDALEYFDKNQKEIFDNFLSVIKHTLILASGFITNVLINGMIAATIAVKTFATTFVASMGKVKIALTGFKASTAAIFVGIPLLIEGVLLGLDFLETKFGTLSNAFTATGNTIKVIGLEIKTFFLEINRDFLDLGKKLIESLKDVPIIGKELDAGLAENRKNFSETNKEIKNTAIEIQKLEKETQSFIDTAAKENKIKLDKDSVKDFKKVLKDLTKDTEVKPSVDTTKLRQEFEKGLKEPFAVLGKALFEDIEIEGNPFLEIITDAGEAFRNSVNESNSSIIGAGISLLTSLQQGAKGFLKGMLQIAKPIAEAFAGPIGAAIIDALTSLIDFFGQAPELFSQMIISSFADLPMLLGNIFTNIAALFSGRLITEAIVQMIENIPYLIESLVSAVVEVFGSPIFWYSLMFQAVAAFIRSIPEIIQGFINGFKNGFDKILGPFKSFFSNIGTTLSKFFGGVKDIGEFFEKAGQIFVDIIKKGFGEIGDLFSNIGKDFIDLVKKGFSGLGNIFSNFGKSIFETFRDLFAKFNPVNILSKMFKLPGTGDSGKVEKFIGLDFPFVKFASGGLVGGKAKYPGDNLLNDTVPALLSPGEIVIPNSIVNKGQDAIDAFTRSVTTNRGLSDFVSDPIGSLLGGFTSAISAITNITSNLGDIASDLFQGNFKDAISKIDEIVSMPILSLPLDMIGYGPLEQFLSKEYREIIATIKRLGGVISVARFIQNPKEEVTRALRGLVEPLFKPLTKGILNKPKLANGGLIPSGYPNDTFPANLSSGELVVDRTTTRRLQDFLDNQPTQKTSNVTDILLTRLIDLLERPITADAKVKIDQRAFGDLILQLNRTNTRVTI